MGLGRVTILHTPKMVTLARVKVKSGSTKIHTGDQTQVLAII